ncbi:MAG: flagellar filament capping protein FliD [Armatimonadota bacterium]|nr:flagellar filament capping protein FliD [bacterium]
MSGTMSVNGLASGLSTDDIVTKILDIARRPQTNMKADKAIAQTKLAVWQNFNTSLLALKTSCDSIADAVDFKTNTVTSSDEDILTASASTDAQVGTYYLTVNKRALAHQVSTANSYTNLNDTVGTGSISFTFAEDSTKNFSVDIDSTNNTLTGLRDSINRANKSVQAAIINTGSSNAPEYRLILTSKDTGKASPFTTKSTLTGGTAPDLSKVVQQGIDAELTFGEGAGAIPVSKSSNTITDLIPGVTLNIASVNTGKIVKIDVERNTDSVKEAITGFVSKYNEIVDAFGAQFTYDADSGETGTLFGDYQLQSVQMDIEAAVGNVVSGLSKEFNALSSLGITQDTDGKLEINDSTLSKALENNLNDVAKVFGANLESDSSYISFAASTSETQPSGNTKWGVEITQAARQAQVTAGTEMGATLDADEKLTINGKDIQLKDGMTRQQVVDEINAHTSDTDVIAVLTDSTGTGTGNFLTLKRARYGSNGNFSAISNRSNDITKGSSSGIGTTLVAPNVPLGESGYGRGLQGLDVQGTINNAECTGNGQILTVTSSSNAASKGLSLVVTSPTAMSTKVQFTKGIGNSLRDLLSKMTSSGGTIANIEESINEQIDDLDKSIADWDTRLAAKSDQLYAKFNSMESQLSNLQQQGNYISSALTSKSSS